MPCNKKYKMEITWDFYNGTKPIVVLKRMFIIDFAPPLNNEFEIWFDGKDGEGITINLTTYDIDDHCFWGNVIEKHTFEPEPNSTFLPYMAYFLQNGWLPFDYFEGGYKLVEEAYALPHQEKDW